MARMVLAFHNWRQTKPDDDNELKIIFLFSLRTEEEHKAGVKPDHNQTFWTEVRLSRDLVTRGGWAGLSKTDKIKAMFRFAQERIQEVGRKLREAPMFWTATGSLRQGPPWDVAKIQFPAAPAVTFEARSVESSSGLGARKAAGLSAG